MTQIAQPATPRFDRERLKPVADAVVVALAVALPWSTSITEICAWLWLAVVIATLDPATLRRTVLSAAGGLPVLLFLLALLGTLWAEVSYYERFEGLKAFYKLLFIPLLLTSFSRSEGGERVFNGFLISCSLLLVAAFLLPLFPRLPVRDYLAQTLFAICIFALADKALTAIQDRRYRVALALAALSVAFLAGIVYAVPVSRTGLAIVPVLVLVFAIKRLPPKAWLGLLVLGVVIGGTFWLSAPTFRANLLSTIQETRSFRPDQPFSRAGERIDIWLKSIVLISRAPVIGHGTGSIKQQFRDEVAPTIGGTSPTTNPFNQTFAVAIQLGVLGGVILFAMWGAHVWLFRGQGYAAWFGLVVVAQNIVGSLFNTHLSDFGQGWIYVLGVGVAGGMMLKNRAAKSPSPSPA